MKYIIPLSVSVYVLAIFLPICSSRYDECQICKRMAKSFLKGMEGTQGGHHEGGDVEWERKKLSKYDSSEIRYNEVTDYVCKEDGDLIVDKGSEMQCHDYYEKHEESFEKWFFKTRFENDKNLTDWLCEDEARACCPHGFFGSDCTPCPMHENKICNEHGFCNGIATRSGTGKCECYPGYTGDLCNSCALNYFATEKGACERCNRVCKDGCKGGSGVEHCSSGCINGWNFVEGQGCQDIDECTNQPCMDENEQCSNSPGSYDCTCKKGFERNTDGKCQIDVVENEQSSEDASDKASTADGTSSADESSSNDAQREPTIATQRISTPDVDFEVINSETTSDSAVDSDNEEFRDNPNKKRRETIHVNLDEVTGQSKSPNSKKFEPPGSLEDMLAEMNKPVPEVDENGVPLSSEEFQKRRKHQAKKVKHLEEVLSTLRELEKNPEAAREHSRKNMRYADPKLQSVMDRVEKLKDKDTADKHGFHTVEL